MSSSDSVRERVRRDYASLAMQPVNAENARPFANEDGRPVWYAFPRWSQDESAIVYQADGKLSVYNLTDKSTTKVPPNDPRVKRAPK